MPSQPTTKHQLQTVYGTRIHRLLGGVNALTLSLIPTNGTNVGNFIYGPILKSGNSYQLLAMTLGVDYSHCTNPHTDPNAFGDPKNISSETTHLLYALFGYPPGTDVSVSLSGYFTPLTGMGNQIPAYRAKVINGTGYGIGQQYLVDSQGLPVLFCYFPAGPRQRILMEAGQVSAYITSYLRNNTGSNIDTLLGFGGTQSRTVLTTGELSATYNVPGEMIAAILMGRACYPIAIAALEPWAASSNANIEHYSNWLNIASTDGAGTQGALMHKVMQSKQNIKIFGAQVQEAQEHGTANLEPYAPVVGTVQPTSHYPGDCQIWLDLSKSPAQVHIPGDMPPRPSVTPMPLASDLAPLVLEDQKFCRIGDVRLPYTLESMSVRERPGIDTVEVLRNLGTMKRNAGHTIKQIEITMLFQGATELNGFTIDGMGCILEDPITKERPILAGTYFEHYGLRPLIATFRRAPFVPVVNHDLNHGYGIDAVALTGIQLQNEDGAPGIIRVTLSMLGFDYQTYLPTAISLADEINWPLFQKYVYNGLCVPAETARLLKDANAYQLGPVTPRALDEQQPQDMLGHIPADLLSDFEYGQATGWWSDDAVEQLSNIYQFLPSQYVMEESSKPVTLTPIPAMEYDISGRGFHRNDALQGGVTFHVADENCLKSIRDSGVRDQQLFQEKEKALSDSLAQAKVLTNQLEALNNVITTVRLTQAVAAKTAELKSDAVLVHEYYGRNGSPVTAGLITLPSAADSAYAYGFAQAWGKTPKDLAACMAAGDQAREQQLNPNKPLNTAITSAMGSVNGDIARAATGLVLGAITKQNQPLTTSYVQSILDMGSAAASAEAQNLATNYITPMQKQYGALTQTKNGLTAAQDKLVAQMQGLTITAHTIPEGTITFNPVTLPSDAILERVEVVMTNNFTQAQLESREQPALQYLGASDTMVRLNFECQRGTVQALQDLYDYVQYLSREYRWVSGHVGDASKAKAMADMGTASLAGQQDLYLGQQMETAFLLLDQELANLCGVNSALISGLEFEKVPEAPDWYTVTLSLVNFDRTQKKHEQLNRILGIGVESTNGASLTFQQSASQASELLTKLMQDALLDETKFNTMLYQTELYPDLELPTYATVNQWIIDIKEQTRVMHYPAGLFQADIYAPPEGDPRLLEFVHVDPDFYISTSLPTVGSMLVDVLYQEDEQRIDMSDEHHSGTYATTLSNQFVPEETNPKLLKQQVKRGGRMDQVNLDFSQGDSLQLNLGNATTQLSAMSRAGGNDNIRSARLHDPNMVDQHGNRITIDPRTTRLKLQDGPELPDQLYCTQGTDIFAESNAQRQKQLCRPMGLNNGVAFKEGSLFANFVDGYQHGKQGRLIKAFPTYWVTLIDDGRVVNQLAFADNFYGMNSLSAITVVKNREHPADLCYLTVSNVYGNLTNMTAQRALDEGIRRQGYSALMYYVDNIFSRKPDAADLLRRDREAVGLFLQPGARLHVRMGYGSCPAALPILFNGVITEVPGGEGEVQIVAMGDGLELLNDAQGSPNQKVGGFFHGSEPQDLIAPMLGVRGGISPALAGGAMKRFSNWVQRLIYQTFPGWEPDNPFGIKHFGNPFYQIGQEKWGECMQNIYRSNDRGARPGHCFKYDTNDDDATDPLDVKVIKPWESSNWLSQWLGALETMSFGQKEFSTDLFGKTCWDLCVISSQVAPDYISAVVPFQFRSTLFYGKPYYSYCHDYSTEQLKVPCPQGAAGKQTYRWKTYGSLPEHWLPSNAFTGIGTYVAPDQNAAAAPTAQTTAADYLAAVQGGTAPTDTTLHGIPSASFDNYLRYCMPWKDRALLDSFQNLGITSGDQETQDYLWKRFVYAQLRKPFQQYYSITSSDDILLNSITASAEGVYTVVRGTYHCKHFDITLPLVGDLNPFAGPEVAGDPGVHADMTLQLYADYTIFPEQKRSITVDTQIYIGRTDMFAAPFTNRDPHGNLPNNVAATILKNYMAYMYKGELTMLGLPSIKPYDVLVVDDTFNELHGPVGVRRVVHALDTQTGFTSSVEPDALAAIADERLLRNWSMFRTVCGTVAYQRLGLGSAMRNTLDGRTRGIAEQTRQLLELIDYYIVGNKELTSQPAVGAALTALDKVRAPYEALLTRLEQGYSYSPQALQYATEKYQQCTGLTRQTTAMQGAALVLNYGHAVTRVQGSKNGVLQQKPVQTVNLPQDLPLPIYRIPQDIGGPAPFLILGAANSLVGSATASMEQDGLAFLAAKLVSLVPMDQLIMGQAMDQLSQQDPHAYEWVRQQQATLVNTAVKQAGQTLVDIQRWFSPSIYSTRAKHIKRLTDAMPVLGQVRANGAYTELVTCLTLARLLLDVKAKNPLVQINGSITETDYEGAFGRLEEAYQSILAASQLKQGAAPAQVSTQYLANYLREYHPTIFPAAARSIADDCLKDFLVQPIKGITQTALAALTINRLINSKLMYRLTLRAFKTGPWLDKQSLKLAKWYKALRSKEGEAAADGTTVAVEDGTGQQVPELENVPAKAAPHVEEGAYTLAKKKAAQTLRNFFGVENEECDIITLLRGQANDAKSFMDLMQRLKTLNTLAVAGEDTAEAGKALASVSTGLFDLSNPVGLVVGILTMLGTITIGNLVNMTNRQMANLHTIHLMLLQKHGAEFSAGINGHQGLVYGDHVNKLQAVFNQFSGQQEQGKQGPISNWWAQAGITTTAAILGVKFPYCPEMGIDEQQGYKAVDNLFNARSFGEVSIGVLQARGKLGSLGVLLSNVEQGNGTGKQTKATVAKSALPGTATKTTTRATVPAPNTPIRHELSPRDVTVLTGSTFQVAGPLNLTRPDGSVYHAEGQTVTIALLGVQAPSAPAPTTAVSGALHGFAPSAKAALTRVVANATRIILIFDPTALTNSSNVLQAYVYTATGTQQPLFVNAHLAAYGYVARYEPSTTSSLAMQTRHNEIVTAQATAIKKQRGLWRIPALVARAQNPQYTWFKP